MTWLTGLKERTKSVLSKHYGIVVRRNYYPASLEHQFGIDLLIDVGCNRGQYAFQALQSNRQLELILIDALPQCIEFCRDRFLHEPRVSVMDPIALAAGKGEAEFWVSANEYSSSLMRPSAALVEAASGAAPDKKITVSSNRLDSLFTNADLVGRRVMLKIDANGADLEVLRGSTEILDSIAVVQVEVSLPGAGKSESNGNSIFHFLSDAGFELSRVTEGVRNRIGAQLTCDLVMAKLGE